MVKISYSIEATSPIPPARLINAYTNDDLFPKAVPQFFKSVENIQGDGGVGTIKLFKFAEGAPIKSSKHRVDTFEKGSDTYKFKYTVIEVEGGEKNDKIESVSYESSVVPSGDGGSIITSGSIFETKGDAQISEEEIKHGKEKSLGMIKAVEAYLIANPHLYN